MGFAANMKVKKIKKINRRVRKKATKAKIAILAVIAIAVVAAAALSIALFGPGGALQGDAVVASVDGAFVTAAEYQLFAARTRSLVYNQYTSDQIGADDFWTKSIDGQTPLDLMRQMVMSEITSFKVIQNMAADHGIIEPFDFLAYMSQLEEINTRRKIDVAAGGIVYGNITYADFTYYNYFQSNLKAALSDTLRAEFRDSLSQGDLRAYYEDNREKYQIETRVRIITAEVYPDTEAEEAEGFRQLLDVKAAMERGDGIDVLSAGFGDIFFNELTLDNLDTRAGRMGDREGRWLAASAMGQGEISGPLALDGAVMLILCLERDDNLYLPYEEVDEQIFEVLARAREGQLIQDAEAGAEVTFDAGLCDAAARAALGL